VKLFYQFFPNVFVVLSSCFDTITLLSRIHNCIFHYIFPFTFIVKYFENWPHFALALRRHRPLSNISSSIYYRQLFFFHDQMIWFYFLNGKVFLFCFYITEFCKNDLAPFELTLYQA